MKRLLRYRVFVITGLFLLLGIGASLLAKAEELKLSFILLAPLLALAVSALLLFLMKSGKGKKLSSSLRLVALVNFVAMVATLVFYLNLFNRTTFRFVHGDGSITLHVKGNKACYSEAALQCKKENPGISDEELISLCFTNPMYKNWAWSEDCIKKNQLWLVGGYCLVVLLLGSFFSFIGEYFAWKANRVNALFEEDLFESDEISVFISYSHEDKKTADALKVLLEKEKIRVILDSEAMVAGGDISGFVYQSILQSDVTLAIVSRASLLSSWVALETVSTFFLQKFSKNKRFIACSLDNDVFQPAFISQAVHTIDAKLAEINARIGRQDELKVDTRNLNDEKSRLLLLRSHLDEIVYRLQNCLRVDISDGKLAENFPFLLKSICDSATQEVSELA